MIMVSFNAVQWLSDIGLLIQNKFQGKRIHQETILYDDPTVFRIILISILLTFYTVASTFTFLLYREIKQASYDMNQRDDQEDHAINEADEENENGGRRRPRNHY